MTDNLAADRLHGAAECYVLSGLVTSCSMSWLFVMQSHMKGVCVFGL